MSLKVTFSLPYGKHGICSLRSEFELPGTFGACAETGYSSVVVFCVSMLLWYFPGNRFPPRFHLSGV